MTTKIKRKELSIYKSENKYVDREKLNEIYPGLKLDIKEISTVMLLMASKEDDVLIAIFNSFVEFIRKRENNIEQLEALKLFDKLFEHQFYMNNPNYLVRRFALYLADAIVEPKPVLQELNTKRLQEIIALSLEYYIADNDEFCIEYLSVIINNCLDDPHIAMLTIAANFYLDKMFIITAAFTNPDIIYHSLEAIYKMLQVQKFEDRQEFANHPAFPIDQVLCHLTNSFAEIRTAALKVISLLVLDTTEKGLFQLESRANMLLQRLTQVLCENNEPNEAKNIVNVLSLALHSERMVRAYFQLDLFEKLVQFINKQPAENVSYKCLLTKVCNEIAFYCSFLQRLHTACVTAWFIQCLLMEDPAPDKHVLQGLQRMLKHTEAAKTIVESFEFGTLERLIGIMKKEEINIKTREQASELLQGILFYSFHNTAKRILELQFDQVIADIFKKPSKSLSPDFIISLLKTIEELVKFDEYRYLICQNSELIKNMAILLKNSFKTAVVITNMFRTLCTLVDEEPVREQLLENHICACIKFGLESVSKLVKTSITNFIMQTARFPEFVDAYVELRGVLEVLILHQKHSYCVSTWNTAIESILSKKPTVKFAIRNHLNFTDLTNGGDFLVSKKKYEDFRVFQEIIFSESSPLEPIFIVNFNKRTMLEEEMKIIPSAMLNAAERLKSVTGWCYCVRPPDTELPIILEHLNSTLCRLGLLENPDKMKRCIDFENLAKRVKVVAVLVAEMMSHDLKKLDINSPEQCSRHQVTCHLKELCTDLHVSIIPLGKVRTGCQFERAILFKALADQIGLPTTLQRSVDGKILFNEVPLPVPIEQDLHCDRDTLKFMSWRMLRPTHIVDLFYNVGEIYPTQSRQALQYLRLY